jgi:hypothetical protein
MLSALGALPAGGSSPADPGPSFTPTPAGRVLFSRAELQVLLPPPPDSANRPNLLAPPLSSSPRPAAGFVRPSGWARTENALFVGTIVSLVGLHIADYLATRDVLKTLGPEELNPLAKAFSKNGLALVAFKLGTTYLNVAGLRGIHRANKPMAWALSLVSNFLVSLTLASSLEQLDASKNSRPAQR